MERVVTAVSTDFRASRPMVRQPPACMWPPRHQTRMATYSTKALPVMQLYPKKQETRFTEASATDSVGSWLVPPKGLALLGPAPTKPSEI